MLRMGGETQADIHIKIPSLKKGRLLLHWP